MASQDRPDPTAREACPFRLLLIGTDPDCQRELSAGLTTLGWHDVRIDSISDPAAAVGHCRDQRVDLICIGPHAADPQPLAQSCRQARQQHAPVIALVVQHGDASATPPPELDALLSRPVDPAALEALLVGHKTRPETGSGSGSGSGAGADAHAVISARYRGQTQVVALKDVIYLLAGHKYVTVRHPGGELLVERSLRSFEHEHGTLFLRIHRNALVSIQRFQFLEKSADGGVYACLRDCDDRLRVSRRHLPQVRSWLRQRQTENSG